MEHSEIMLVVNNNYGDVHDDDSVHDDGVHGDDDCDLLGDELSWIVSVNRARQK